MVEHVQKCLEVARNGDDNYDDNANDDNVDDDEESNGIALRQFLLSLAQKLI